MNSEPNGSKPFALLTVGWQKSRYRPKPEWSRSFKVSAHTWASFCVQKVNGLASAAREARVRLHHQKPCNRRVTHAVGGCKAGKAGKACHAFQCAAVVHRVPNNPLFVLLPDFVSHRSPGKPSQISQPAIRNHPRQIALLWRITPFSSVRTAYPHFSSVISLTNKS